MYKVIIIIALVFSVCFGEISKDDKVSMVLGAVFIVPLVVFVVVRSNNSNIDSAIKNERRPIR